MTVLLTGARGLVGRWVLRSLLNAGEEVHAVARAIPDQVAGDDGVSWHVADLLDGRERQQLLARTRPEHLVHLAWETTHGRFWDSPLNAAWEEATVDLVRRARESGTQRVVVAGTCAEYDWTRLDDVGGVCSESSTPLGPVTQYGKAKLRTFERLAGLPEAESWLAWGRVFSPFGPGEDPRRLLPSLVVALLEGRPATVASPGLVRDYLHAADVGRGLAALLLSDVCGAVNVASGSGVSLGGLAAELARLVGRPDLLRLGGGSRRESEPMRLVADVARLREEVGSRPTLALTEGLQDVIAWWRTTGQ